MLTMLTSIYANGLERGKSMDRREKFRFQGKLMIKKNILFLKKGVMLIGIF